MITPEQFDALPDAFAQEIQSAEEDIIAAIAKELANAEDLEQALYTRPDIRPADVEDEEINVLLLALLAQLVADEKKVYAKLGIISALNNRDVAKGLVEPAARQASAALKQITGSLGARLDGRWQSINDIYTTLVRDAVAEVRTGAVTADKAIKKAVVKLTDSGIRTIDYASGRTEYIDVAVRRTVVTSMHQLAGQAAEFQANELGTSLYEVSAHAGARSDGFGYENHASWQGRVYWYQTPVEGYESLVAATGYGDALGLEGINCRHSKHPFVDRVSIRAYTDKELAEIDPGPFTFEGRAYNAYEATQTQRKIERNMRLYKRRIVGLEAAGFGKGDPTYNQARSLLQAWSRKYTQFSSAAGLQKQPERARAVGFKR